MVFSTLELSLFKHGQFFPLSVVGCDDPAFLRIFAAACFDQSFSDPSVDRLVTDLQFASEIGNVPFIGGEWAAGTAAGGAQFVP